MTPTDPRRATRRATRRAATIALFATLILAASAAASNAAVPGAAPAFQITTLGSPSILSPTLGTEGRYQVAVENVGAATSSGDITIKDKLPPGLRITNITNVEPGENGYSIIPNRPGCSSDAGGDEATCTYHEPVVPAGFMSFEIVYAVDGAISSLTNTVQVSGGGATTVSETNSTRRAGHENEHSPEEITKFTFQATGPAGQPFTQAAGRPNFQTTRLTLTGEPGGEGLLPEEPVKDVVFYLPLGMLGDAQIAETCPIGLIETNASGGLTSCPTASRVGTILPFVRGQLSANTVDATHAHGIYNVTPEHGYAAEFAFSSNNYDFLVYASVVRHNGQYMLRVATPGIPEIINLLGLVASFDGDLTEQVKSGQGETTFDRGAFLTNPSDCGESAQAREASVAINTWEASGTTATSSSDTFPALEGCDQLSLPATLTTAPDPGASGDTNQADEPSGYRMDLQTPQNQNDGSGLATPPYKRVQFTFPQGTSLNPGAANGLTACSATGPNGIDVPQEGNTLAPGAGIPGEPAGEGEAVAPDGLPRPVAGHCPSTSVVGAATATTPLLGEPLKGHLYLAEPGCGNAAHNRACTPEDAADGNLFGLYLELEAPQRGVIIKLAGSAHVDPDTGQVKAIFEGTPQFPVSDLVIETTGGPRASLANPQTCGSATTTGLITPWSTETPAAEPSGSFNVLWGAGSSCPASSPFNPTVTAGSTSSNAGAYSPFTLVLKREDREQDVQSITTALPPGLLAAVSHVTQCTEPALAQNQCPASSRVGSTTVAIGSGSAPFYQTGQVYFTGPYGGAPFGLSVVVPAVAGPFNLGNVTVRVALHIDPNTAAVTAVSSPLPQIIDGVPLRIRTIALTLDAPAFTFNPTSCASKVIAAAVNAVQGASVSLSVPFQATGCQTLPFKPVFTAAAAGRASRAGGASLDVRVVSKGGPQASGGEANIRSVKVDLPKQLPSRLTTLQKACTEAQFNANPAGCPKASDVGTASASTPVLAHPLAGPAYLVSHGGAAFPDLEIILQGEGVMLVLDGNTFISKAGITSSTFKTVPDAPISSFELKLPTGKFSVLGANVSGSSKYDLCGQKLSMPTALTGQNGVVLKQSTKIALTGCARVKKAAKSKHKKKKATKSTRRGK